MTEEYQNEIVVDDDNDDEELALSGGESSKIYTDQGDPEVDGLHGRYKRGRLDIQPLFQRYFVWDITKSSRLIESALLDIPLPVVYLTEEQDGKVYVIDGQQRLTSFFSFIDGAMPDKTPFKLKGLKVLSEFEGKKFSELDEEAQNKIRECKLRTITFKKESNPNLKFEIFERLNTGSVPLNTQELRNCIYRGKYNQLLKELARDPTFLELLNLSQPDRRMKDVELVLRFAAFFHSTHINYKAPIKSFLNTEMERLNNISDDDAERLKAAFKNAVSIIKSLLNEHAFKRFYRGTDSDKNGTWEAKRFNTSLFDILMDSFARADKNVVFQHLDAIRESFIDLMTTDDEFIDAIEIGTSQERKVTKRFDKWRNRLQEVIDVHHHEPRCFSYQLKKEMFESDPTCGLCGNRIASIDDSAIDHIEQYWTGGKTIPENARLAHRFCNCSRSRYDAA